jgi:hypothetical protein
MKCEGCGSDSAYLIQMGFDDKGNKWERCNGCGGYARGTPDVYFKGAYLDENLSSQEHPGPKMITSRQEKKYWLAKCNLREAGDRVHGATSFDQISSRHAMESLRRH